MKKHHNSLNIRNACKFLNVSRSGYYAFLKRGPSKHSIEDEALKEEIKSIFTEHKGRYGTRRIKAELEVDGMIFSRRRIGRLLREQSLYTKGIKRKYITYKKILNIL